MKKVIYISNVNLEGTFLPGVILKIRGQEASFKNAGFKIDVLYPGENNTIVIQKHTGEKQMFKGGREVRPGGSVFSKISSHYQVSWHGSIDFTDCFATIAAENYDAIYLRFYLPGKDLIDFLEKIKKACPRLIVLLEYPTLNIKELFKSSLVRRVTYSINQRRIEKLNQLSDYFITLTKHKELFGKPAIFMANGLAMDDIKPVEVPLFNKEIILLGVTGDCAFYHGYDKILKGLSFYNNSNTGCKVKVKIISNPLSTYVDELRTMAEKLGISNLVTFELPKNRKELAIEYQRSHMGIGTLALHRINLMDNYSLKHREYAAFGLPFIMSKGDEFFENSPFVHTVERDDEPINIQQLVDFYLSLRQEHPSYPGDFRKSVEQQISWEAQLKNVFEVIRN
ncbi:MAG: glycosyltransferase [Chitinophagaceae bacterium]|nr:glycosyltransferase [Chitinophagaceae bacterium]